MLIFAGLGKCRQDGGIGNDSKMRSTGKASRVEGSSDVWSVEPSLPDSNAVPSRAAEKKILEIANIRLSSSMPHFDHGKQSITISLAFQTEAEPTTVAAARWKAGFNRLTRNCAFILAAGSPVEMIIMGVSRQRLLAWSAYDVDGVSR